MDAFWNSITEEIHNNPDALKKRLVDQHKVAPMQVMGVLAHIEKINPELAESIRVMLK